MNIHVCIPLKSKAVTSNWEKECLSLRYVFDSIFYQKQTLLSPIIYLACHDVPEFINSYKYKNNINIIKADNLPIPVSSIEKNKDKQLKKRLAIEEITKKVRVNDLIAIFDADDLCHSELFLNIEKQVKTTQNTDFVFYVGYMYNIDTKDFAYLDGVNKVFYKNCGSCIISKVLGSDVKDNLNFFYKLDNHTQFYEICENNKRSPQKFTFPAMLYMHNSVNNLSSGNIYVRQIFKDMCANASIHKLNLSKFFYFDKMTKKMLKLLIVL